MITTFVLFCFLIKKNSNMNDCYYACIKLMIIYICWCINNFQAAVVVDHFPVHTLDKGLQKKRKILLAIDMAIIRVGHNLRHNIVRLTFMHNQHNALAAISIRRRIWHKIRECIVPFAKLVIGVGRYKKVYRKAVGKKHPSKRLGYWFSRDTIATAQKLMDSTEEENPTKRANTSFWRFIHKLIYIDR